MNTEQKEKMPLPGLDEPIGIPGKDFIPVAWVDACELYGKWKIVRAEKDLGWISVKDRLPEDDGWYLTCVRMEHLGNTPQIVCPLFFWKKYKRWEDADGLYNGKIDYWMPIPELPKEEEK